MGRTTVKNIDINRSSNIKIKINITTNNKNTDSSTNEYYLLVAPSLHISMINMDMNMDMDGSGVLQVDDDPFHILSSDPIIIDNTEVEHNHDNNRNLHQRQKVNYVDYDKEPPNDVSNTLAGNVSCSKDQRVGEKKVCNMTFAVVGNNENLALVNKDKKIKYSNNQREKEDCKTKDVDGGKCIVDNSYIDSGETANSSNNNEDGKSGDKEATTITIDDGIEDDEGLPLLDDDPDEALLLLLSSHLSENLDPPSAHVLVSCLLISFNPSSSLDTNKTKSTNLTIPSKANAERRENRDKNVNNNDSVPSSPITEVKTNTLRSKTNTTSANKASIKTSIVISTINLLLKLSSDSDRNYALGESGDLVVNALVRLFDDAIGWRWGNNDPVRNVNCDDDINESNNPWNDDTNLSMADFPLTDEERHDNNGIYSGECKGAMSLKTNHYLKVKSKLKPPVNWSTFCTVRFSPTCPNTVFTQTHNLPINLLEHSQSSSSTVSSSSMRIIDAIVMILRNLTYVAANLRHVAYSVGAVRVLTGCLRFRNFEKVVVSESNVSDTSNSANAFGGSSVTTPPPPSSSSSRNLSSFNFCLNAIQCLQNIVPFLDFTGRRLCSDAVLLSPLPPVPSLSSTSVNSNDANNDTDGENYSSNNNNNNIGAKRMKKKKGRKRKRRVVIQNQNEGDSNNNDISSSWWSYGGNINNSNTALLSYGVGGGASLAHIRKVVSVVPSVVINANPTLHTGGFGPMLLAKRLRIGDSKGSDGIGDSHNCHHYFYQGVDAEGNVQLPPNITIPVVLDHMRAVRNILPAAASVLNVETSRISVLAILEFLSGWLTDISNRQPLTPNPDHAVPNLIPSLDSFTNHTPIIPDCLDDGGSECVPGASASPLSPSCSRNNNISNIEEKDTREIFLSIPDDTLSRLVNLLHVPRLGKDSMEYIDPVINTLTRISSLRTTKGEYDSDVDFELRDRSLELLTKLADLDHAVTEGVANDKGKASRGDLRLRLGRRLSTPLSSLSSGRQTKWWKQQRSSYDRYGIRHDNRENVKKVNEGIAKAAVAITTPNIRLFDSLLPALTTLIGKEQTPVFASRLLQRLANTNRAGKAYLRAKLGRGLLVRQLEGNGEGSNNKGYNGSLSTDNMYQLYVLLGGESNYDEH